MSHSIQDQALPSTVLAPTLTLPQSAEILGRLGSLEVRLATSETEVNAAQALRFQIFADELGGRLEQARQLEQRDADRFDEFCDHLLVFDTALPGPAHRQIVGTYRLLRQEQALESGFYSTDEFEIGPLIQRHPTKRFLELGRSCVIAPYRSKRTIELLWQGIWAYVKRHRIDVMIGCASFSGTVPAAHAESLSFLAHHCAASGAWAVSAVPNRALDMDLMPLEAINPKTALSAMPALIKGYLRIGAQVGQGCVVDEDFNTTDVFIVLPVERISERYISYYGGGMC